MSATARQKAVNLLMQRAAKANGHQPLTLKHRSLAGTQTTQVAGASTNTRLRARSGNKTLETTTDSQVWVVWMPMRVRGGAADGGDTPAGRQWDGRWFGQCAAVDINNQPITVFDDDWIVGPIGLLYQIENPSINADGSYYTFGAVQQR